MARVRTVTRVSLAGLAAVSILASACGSSDSQEDRPTVVIVSGLAAISPYTTPDAACASGFAAGNTDSFLRQQMLGAGFDVYTAPAMIGGGPVVDQAGEGGPFADCPAQPPAEVTANPIVSPLTVGGQVADFLRYLKDTEGVDAVHVVAHSMGGVFSRVAIADLKDAGDGPRILSLTTVGSPWEPVMLGDFAPGEDPSAACDGNEACLAFQAFALSVPSIVSEMLPFVQSANFLPWSRAQAGVLDGIPVTLIGGTYFTKEGGSPATWPNDAVVQIDQALARGVSDEVLPHRTCHSFPNTHSLSVSAMVQEPEETALTWNPAVAEVVIAGINAAPTASESPNRQGCPTP